MGEIDQFLKDIYFFDLGLDEDYIYWLIATIPCLPLPPFVSKNHQNKYYFGLFDMELDMHPAVLYIQMVINILRNNTYEKQYIQKQIVSRITTTQNLNYAKQYSQEDQVIQSENEVQIQVQIPEHIVAKFGTCIELDQQKYKEYVRQNKENDLSETQCLIFPIQLIRLIEPFYIRAADKLGRTFKYNPKLTLIQQSMHNPGTKIHAQMQNYNVNLILFLLNEFKSIYAIAETNGQLKREKQVSIQLKDSIQNSIILE